MQVTTERSPSLRTAGAAVLVHVLAMVIGLGGVLVLPLVLDRALKAHLAQLIAGSVAVYTVVAFLGLFWVLRRAGLRAADVGLRRPGPRLLHVLWQIPLALTAVLAVQGVVMSLGGDPTRDDSQDRLLGHAGPVVAVSMFLMFAVAVPLLEEILFRGIIQGALTARWGAVIGVLGTAAVFALAHVAPMVLPYMLTAGVALSLMRRFHGNLWGPFALHLTINAIASAAILAALAG